MPASSPQRSLVPETATNAAGVRVTLGMAVLFGALALGMPGIGVAAAPTAAMKEQLTRVFGAEAARPLATVIARLGERAVWDSATDARVTATERPIAGGTERELLIEHRGGTIHCAQRSAGDLAGRWRCQFDAAIADAPEKPDYPDLDPIRLTENEPEQKPKRKAPRRRVRRSATRPAETAAQAPRAPAPMDPAIRCATGALTPECRDHWRRSTRSLTPEGRVLLTEHAARMTELERGLKGGPVDRTRLFHERLVDGTRGKGAELFDGPPPPVVVWLNHDPRRPRELLVRPEERCFRSDAFGERSEQPPEFVCLRDVLRYKRVKRRGVYDALAVAAAIVQMPALISAMETEVLSANEETISRSVWVYAWLAWVTKHPGKLDHALVRLSSPERALLQEQLLALWRSPAGSQYASLITRIFEEKLTMLVPACRRDDGSPDRTCFTSGYLWGLNWLAAHERLSEVELRAAFKALRSAQKLELRALVSLEARPLKRPAIQTALRVLRSLGSAEQPSLTM